MKFTVEQPVAEYEQYVPDLVPYARRIIPLRIGNIAYPATLESVGTPEGGYVQLAFDLPDSDLRYEALVAPHWPISPMAVTQSRKRT